MSGNLLVVDWDYFFYNPLYAVHGNDDRFWLFDWGHQESKLFIEMLWPSRAAGFLRNGFDLPHVVVPPDWWDRFNIAEDAVCEISDSNMYSGVVDNHREFDHVWLFDAHHDLFTVDTPAQLNEWKERGQVTCEDWMWAHYLRGAKLHWRWPRWFDYGKNVRAKLPKWVNLDARRDDMGRFDPRMEINAVSICRSGAWVPPWDDVAFEQFYLSCPTMEHTQVDEVDLVREWDITWAQEHAEVTTRQMAELAQKEE